MEFTKESYNCSVCGQNDTTALFTKQGFAIVQCKHCDFVYVNPRISNQQLPEIYQHNYFHNHDFGYNGYEQEKRLRLRNFEKWLDDAGRFIAKKKTVAALDVGCAAGYCLEVMKARGWSVEGIELDEEMLSLLDAKHLKATPKLLEHFDATHKFDVITLFDVIEHIAHLDSAFKKLHDLLTENGVVIIVTPDHSSLHRKMAGKKWFQYKPVEHIQYFTPTSLSAVAKRNNLKTVFYKSCGQFADSDFLINRLENYHFSLPAKILKRAFKILGIKNKYFYIDTGSLFAVLKKSEP